MWKRCFCVFYNLLKIFSGYIFSLIFHRTIHWGHPISISIEPTNKCNLKCPECPTGQHGLTRSSGSIDIERFKIYVDQAGKKLLYLILYFQGEPYLNRLLFDMISYAKSKKIYVWSSTNGHYLTEENIRKTIESGLDNLVISLDGTNQEAYENYRVGGDYETVVQGIRDFIRIRKEMGIRHPRLEIQFLVLKSNQHQIKEIKKLGNSLGVDRTVLKTAQFYDFEQGNPLMPDGGQWSRYRKKGTKAGKHGGMKVRSHQSQISSHQYIIKNKLRNRCFRMWSGCVITWDGKVVPCCFDKDAVHTMGDMNEQSFDKIWRGEKYREFRKRILKNRKSIEICRNCTQRW
ncbi:MAG: SPASM domain-containing protein [Bacteroidales bacterium]|nr:SPASM domain-containing protein [Bacteroidota bacterium]MBL6950605.1 SPASM domain-containing protein [Bacteroidales bacterium]